MLEKLRMFCHRREELQKELEQSERCRQELEQQTDLYQRELELYRRELERQTAKNKQLKNTSRRVGVFTVVFALALCIVLLFHGGETTIDTSTFSTKLAQGDTESSRSDSLVTLTNLNRVNFDNTLKPLTDTTALERNCDYLMDVFVLAHDEATPSPTLELSLPKAVSAQKSEKFYVQQTPVNQYERKRSLTSKSIFARKSLGITKTESSLRTMVVTEAEVYDYLCEHDIESEYYTDFGKLWHYQVRFSTVRPNAKVSFYTRSNRFEFVLSCIGQATLATTIVSILFFVAIELDRRFKKDDKEEEEELDYYAEDDENG